MTTNFFNRTTNYVLLIILLVGFIVQDSSVQRFGGQRYIAQDSSSIELAKKSNLSLLYTAETLFFNPKDLRRFGVEIEFSGLSPEEAVTVIRKTVGGRVTVDTDIVVGGIKEKLPNGQIIYQTRELSYYTIKDTLIGDIRIIPELNEIGEIVDLNKTTPFVEVVTSPIQLDSLPSLQKIATALQKAGAIGTHPGNPVGIHVTLEIGKGHINQYYTPNFLVDLMRNYMSPKHRKLMDKDLLIPGCRKKYLGQYSPGFTKRLMDRGYRPTLDQLYEDFIYRQTLELMDKKYALTAWSWPISKVERLVRNAANPFNPRVAKFHSLRITSLLVAYRPDDPMSKLFTETWDWITPGPVVEIREFNNDFDVVTPVKRSLGMLSATDTFGTFKHNILLEEITSLDRRTLQAIRNALKSRDPPLIFRYMLADPYSIDLEDYEEIAEIYREQNTVMGYLPEDYHGQKPLLIPGESVVFHRRPHHRFSVLGKYNPGLINHNIAQALENKYVEFRFWEDNVPGCMPRTTLLSNIISESNDPLEVVRKLDAQFPDGWVMKGVWDLATEQSLVTDKLDLAEEIKKYRASNFDKYYRKMSRRLAGEDPEELIDALKKHRGYMGWKISTFLEEPAEVIVQQKVKIAREFRVEVIAGHVLANGSTLDRYAYQFEEAGRTDFKYSSPEVIRKIENHAQSIVDQLPPHLRGTPFAMDIALLEDGGLIMIESNAGGNSGFLALEDDSIEALNDFLRRYPQLQQEGKIPLGLTPQQQMTYLKEKLHQWNVDISVQYEDMKFLDDRIIDPDFEISEVTTKNKSFQKKWDAQENNCLGIIMPFLANLPL